MFYGLHHTQYIIITGTYSWNDKTFSFQLTSVITGYANVWLKLNPHFWKQVTTVIRVAQHHNSAIKCNASTTLSSVLHDKATCNLWQKILLAELKFEWLIIPIQKKWKMLVHVWGTMFAFFRFSCWSATHRYLKSNIFLFWEIILETVSKASLCNHSFPASYIFCGQLNDILKSMRVSLSPVINGKSLSVLLALQANSTVSFSLQFFLPLQISPFKHNVLLGGSLKNSSVSSPLQMFLCLQFQVSVPFSIPPLLKSNICALLIQFCIQRHVLAWNQQ